MTDDERGAVTAETALAIPVLVGLTLVMVWMVAFGIGQMRATDAAREAARALARGESEAEAAALVAAVDPGARMSVRVDGDQVVVTVTRPVAGGLGLLEGLSGQTRASATAVLEQSASAGAASSLPAATAPGLSQSGSEAPGSDGPGSEGPGPEGSGPVESVRP